MKALTIWQPWASLIMLGAKPYEFRRWDYRVRDKGLVDQRIAIHAGARPMKKDEIEDILERLDDKISSLDPAIARPLCARILASFAETPTSSRRRARHAPEPVLPGFPEPPDERAAPVVVAGQTLPLSALLGTAIIGKPRKVSAMFSSPADSDRIDHHMWGWPLTEIQRFDAPVPDRGAQGFWSVPASILAEGVTTAEMART